MRMLYSRRYHITSVFAFPCGRAKTIRIRYVWTRIFSKTEEKTSVLKNIRIRVDRALDSIYGDPRFVSDTITQDIVKFKALEEGEDACFCDLVHLVRRGYNTLKEVGLLSDMDNSHMLSIIEQKMCANDRKVWSRDLERERKPATLNALINWMSTEMKSRTYASNCPG